jgi:eukaryotic-like serine/threonine-protein kinase
VFGLATGEGSAVIGIGTTLNQRFLLEKELGRGGMGAVYSATDQVLQRSVAIKLLREQSGEEVGRRLRLEAQIAARLLHDNVVRIYDFGEAEGTWYLVMEQVDGTSYVKRWRGLTLVERLRVLAQVADALDYAHHQGVIHRDIKPGNVLLTSTDVPKLSDFGLSLMAEQADDAGAIRGTPHYMSPEQTKGKRLDYRTDLYSLGVMLYESAAGSVPFTGTPMSVMTQHAGTAPEPPRSRNPGISASLNQYILSLLAKRPEDRPASGAAVAEALRAEIERIGAEEPDAPEHVIDAEPAVPAVPDLATLAKLEEAEAVIPLTAPAPVKTRVVAQPAPRPAPAPTSAADLVTSALVRKMLRTVFAEPVILSADERYLMGHYLAYLLIWPRGQRIFRRQSLDHRNADRARYLLAMTYALASGPTEEAVNEAASLLDQQVEVRPALSPVVLAKYLSWRDTPQRRRLFRQTRKALQEASQYAQKSLTDAKGLLNPGLMPQSIDDLQRIAPARTLVDDVLVERWNRLAEVWRDHPEFRAAALRYTSREAVRDPASQALWPEVVYPLIERARWQRRFRSLPETIWDALVGRILHMGDAGVELDRLLTRAVPAQVVAQIDDSVNLMARKPPAEEEEDEAEDAGADETERLSISAASLDIDELAADQERKGKSLVFLKDPDPVRFLQGQLHELWKEAANVLHKPEAPAKGSSGSFRPRPGATHNSGHRHIPLGPYRLIVVASIRGKAAGQIAIQGMANKQIELTTPSFRTTGSAGRPILAVWLYRDNSLVLSHLDFQGTERYVLWHAPLSHQLKFDDPADLLRELQTLGMEPPDQLEQALSKRFRPRDRV